MQPPAVTLGSFSGKEEETETASVVQQHLATRAALESVLLD